MTSSQIEFNPDQFVNFFFFFFFLPGSVKDHIETRENAKETLMNSNKRKYELHNGGTLQDGVVGLNRIVMNS